MRPDMEKHVMRVLMGLVGLGVLLLIALLAQAIGNDGWQVVIVLAGGAAAVYLLGVLVIAVLDRIDR